MPRQSLVVTQQFSEPREAVFARLTDHATFGRILGNPMTRIKDAVGENLNGLGSVRRIKIGPVSFEETVTAFEPPKRQCYTVSKGSPIKDHEGELIFTDNGDGTTTVNYTIVFSPKVPLTGGLIKTALETGIRKALAADARRHAAS